ncbi:hypothetical protein MJO28_009442 [Puccinia striiformis f. sp. tritici]|uniref:Uncharacterized protein n=1 Tax=Puccinia striiformis f. sp. tritici TaxID=168172 RepID=A0ACC0E783_9BASI|nr:hypothetical protein MJO28_009442 [Puccinia striiformis f. sp. tritici]
MGKLSSHPLPHLVRNRSRENKLTPEQKLRHQREYEAFQRWRRGEVSPEIRQLTAEIKARDKKHMQQYKERRLADLIPTIKSAYLLLQGKTNNWESSDRFKDFSSEFDSCSCDACKHKRRSVQTIDINSRAEDRRHSVLFLYVLPIILAYWHVDTGASPYVPHTAFSLPLLRLHDQLLRHCRVGNLPASTHIWLETRSLTLMNNSGKVFEFLVIFGILRVRSKFSLHFPTSIRIHQALLIRSHDTLNDTPKLTQQQALGLVSCPVCSSRNVRENGGTVDQINRLLVICPESNIQHRFHFPKDRNYNCLVALSKSIHLKPTNESKPVLVQS